MASVPFVKGFPREGTGDVQCKSNRSGHGPPWKWLRTICLLKIATLCFVPSNGRGVAKASLWSLYNKAASKFFANSTLLDQLYYIININCQSSCLWVTLSDLDLTRCSKSAKSYAKHMAAMHMAYPMTCLAMSCSSSTVKQEMHQRGKGSVGQQLRSPINLWSVSKSGVSENMLKPSMTTVCGWETVSLSEKQWKTVARTALVGWKNWWRYFFL